jgi:quercetin dioxygenase-like cupin family protein
MTSRREIAAVLALTIAVGAVAYAAEQQLRLTPDDIAKLPTVGGVAGTSRSVGTVTTVLSGDPSKPGIYTIRVSAPPNTTIGAHSHRDDRTAVVVAGAWYFGYGQKFDAAALKEMPPGSFYTEPGGTAHFAQTKGETAVIYITGYGPTDTSYVNPADDPGKR